MTEMRGYTDLGMQREATKLASRFLKRTPLETEALNAAIEGLLVHGDRLKQWSPLVESAYARLPKSVRRTLRPAMLYFYYSAGEFKKAEPFVPRRLDPATQVLEAAFGIDLLVEPS